MVNCCIVIIKTLSIKMNLSIVGAKPLVIREFLSESWHSDSLVGTVFCMLVIEDFRALLHSHSSRMRFQQSESRVRLFLQCFLITIDYTIAAGRATSWPLY